MAAPRLRLLRVSHLPRPAAALVIPTADRRRATLHPRARRAAAVPAAVVRIRVTFPSQAARRARSTIRTGFPTPVTSPE